MTKLLAILGLVLAVGVQAGQETHHALSMYGDVKYGPDFTHFDYVNVKAPKGGMLKLGVVGTFDSFNPFISKGIPAAGLSPQSASYVWDSLTVRSLDEPFTEYGLLAERMEMPEDRSWVIFHLRPQARFADGKPVTADDVKWTFDTLTSKGQPFYSYYYGSVASVDVLGPKSVKFTFKESNNRELPLIVGQLPVLPKHFWQDREFDKVELQTLPLGSGPYRVASFKPGKWVVYERREDYWARDLPVNRGHHNFDRVVMEYFLDETVILEAFKGGAFDFRSENSAKNWATAYDSPALRKGEIIKEEISHELPAGMQGYIYNIRRPVFQNPVLREALAYALDFEWSNQNLFYGQYTRTRSFFENSEMAATGLPSKAELALLEPWRKVLPEETFSREYQPPRTDGSGSPRANLSKAQGLLKSAGYSIRDNQLFTPDGTPVKFEILLYSPAFERITLPFVRNLKVLGVEATVRRIDPQQYTERLRNFDFDMVVATFGQSTSPGNEQRDFWSSDAADRPDSRNLIGIKNPAIDDLVEKLIQADTREELVTRTQALDRALQWGHYVIPQWHIDRYRLAYRHYLKHPKTVPPYGLSTDIWWYQQPGD